MRSIVDELTNELAELQTLVNSITPVNQLLAEHHDSLVRQYLTIRRRFDYAAFIVAIYASFEKFAENLVSAYARLAASINKYNTLPEKLTRKHIRKSAEILFRGRLGEGRYVGIQSIDVVKNLFNCLSEAPGYVLNESAVVAHDLNLRYDELVSLFSDVGIDQIRNFLQRGDNIVKWYCDSNNLEEPPGSGVPIDIIQKRLDDLVERRNQVAHRGGNPDEILGPSEMTDLVNFIDALAKSIYALTVEVYLRNHHVKQGSAIRLQLKEGPYKNGRVVVVQRPMQTLYVGQPVFTFVDGSGARWDRILELRVNNASTDTVDGPPTTKEETVGISFNFKCPRSAELFVLNADDDVIWSPLPSSHKIKRENGEIGAVTI